MWSRAAGSPRLLYLQIDHPGAQAVPYYADGTTGTWSSNCAESWCEELCRDGHFRELHGGPLTDAKETSQAGLCAP